ncbi:MAG: nuclear transport factor 2 family protein [Algoriphagus sp.]|uniref:YybH family protein n=1 Tax=Algoriphagus sp. TaxID=1872435 RepID=UPI00272F5C62|nr:nuclear transport factor 2 family protein [Algoriphagus sp.]MDP2040196.1 nuclear transport factor 2 family protein [Algoriphagus sp.]MDP3471631.1 nuclear transport factor 2 family protein [Algoriphagus sp.]
MNTTTYFRIAPALIALTFFGLAGCAPAPENVATPEPVVVESKPDMSAIKAEIQAIETAFAAADNARDVNAILAFYSDDAVTMGPGEPMSVGKAAIQKSIEAGIAKSAAGSTVAYDVLEVFGDGNTVTEVGKSTRKDASGKVTYTGKYMAIWEMSDGKYVCIRDIGNSDAKEN